MAAASAFGLNVAAEIMGSQEGLGYLMIVQQTYLRTHGLVAIVILYCILAFAADRAIVKLGDRLTYWTERRVTGRGEFEFY